MLIQIGVVLMALGAFLLYNVISLQITITQMIIPLGVFGIGMGLLMAHLVNLILSSVSPDDSPEASGVNNAMDQLGNSLGTAVVGSLLMAFFLSNVVGAVLTDTQIESTAEQRSQIVVAWEDARETFTDAERAQFFESLPQEIQKGLSAIADKSVITAMEDVLLVIVGLLLIMLLLSTFLPKREDRDIPLVRARAGCGCGGHAWARIEGYRHRQLLRNSSQSRRSVALRVSSSFSKRRVMTPISN